MPLGRGDLVMERVGVIAGKGFLPSIWVKAAREKGNRVYAFQLSEVADYSLEGIADQVKYFSIGELNNLIQSLHTLDIDKVVMIGKVEKSLLFSDIKLDNRMKGLLAELEVLNDDSILLAIVEELASEGIEVLKQSTFIEDLFPEPGVLTSLKPDEQLLSDMTFGFKMAREIGRLDIGQTVVVKDRSVLAVEAIEGTDQAIKRGGEIGGPGTVIAKVSKPGQDWRFDIPTVGLTTLQNMIAIKARGLVIEAGKTFLIDKTKLLEKAEENGLVVMALDTTTIE